MQTQDREDASYAERRDRLGVACSGGLGAAWGLLAYQVTLGPGGMFSSLESWLLVLVPALLKAFGEHYVRGMLARFAGRRRSSATQEAQQRRPMRSFERLISAPVLEVVTFVLLILLILLEGAPPEGRVLVREWLSALLIAGVVTFYWTRGAWQVPPGAARRGGLAGAIAGGVVWLVVVTFTRRWAAPGEALRQVILAALTWGLYGAAAGIAIERGWWSRAGVRVGVGVAAAVILLNGVYGLFYWPSLHGLLKPLMSAAGWGLGLLLYRPSEVMLTVSGAPVASAGPEGSRA